MFLPPTLRTFASLWPLFGIANQLLALRGAVFCHNHGPIKMGKARHIWVTLVPLAWLGSATFAAALQKSFIPTHVLGLWPWRKDFRPTLAAGKVPAAKRVATEALIFNNYLDAVAAGIFLVLVIAILVVSIREWVLILSGRKVAVLHETEPVWLPRRSRRPRCGVLGGVWGQPSWSLARWPRSCQAKPQPRGPTCLRTRP